MSVCRMTTPVVFSMPLRIPRIVVEHLRDTVIGHRSLEVLSSDPTIGHSGDISVPVIRVAGHARRIGSSFSTTESKRSWNSANLITD